MKKINSRAIFKYLYDQLTGNFAGFLIGSSATGLVSQFFETRSLRNLWGLTAKKTVVDKDTFHNLEWIISIIIGFIVFELVTKIIKENFPRYKRAAFRWLISQKLHHKTRAFSSNISGRGVIFFATVHQGVKQAFSRVSNRD